ncbi:MAG: hypothetical protein ABFE01_29455, partial [Phycisphaerales bacterium]
PGQGLSRRFGMEDLERALEAQALSGPMVELADVGAKLIAGDERQVGALRQVLTQGGNGDSQCATKAYRTNG